MHQTPFVCSQSSIESQPFMRLNAGPSLKAPEFKILNIQSSTYFSLGLNPILNKHSNFPSLHLIPFVCSQNSAASQPFVRLNVGPSLKAPEFEILFSERPRMKRISGQPYLPSPGQPRHGEAVGVLLKTKRIRRQMILRLGS